MPTVCELARSWGVSHQYVSMLVKKGCPKDSYLSAAAWRENHASTKLSTHPKRIAQFIGEEPQVDSSRVRQARRKNLQLKMERETPLPSDPIELILHRAIQVADGIWRLLQQAMSEGRDSKIQVRLSLYNRALDARLRMEELCRQEIEHRRNLIPMENVRRFACKALNVIISNLAALPEKAGPACNPEAPAQAIAVLKGECANIIVDARRSFPKEISEGIQWPEYPT